MNTACDTPSESVTMSVVHMNKTVWIAMYMASTFRGHRGERQSDAAIMGCAVGLGADR